MSSFLRKSVTSLNHKYQIVSGLLTKNHELSAKCLGSVRLCSATPHIFDTKSVHLELEKDKIYKWCTCGYSAKQPFCDGSHKKTPPGPGNFRSLKFTVEETKVYKLCLCKHTMKPPFCDGSHKPLRK